MVPVGVRLCVFCRRHPAQAPWEPFCSERCKLADLGRWLSESDRVPEDPPADEPGPGASNEEA